MKRRLLDLEIADLTERIKTMRRRSEDYYNATRKLRDLVIDRMRRDDNAKRNRRKIAA